MCCPVCGMMHIKEPLLLIRLTFTALTKMFSYISFGFQGIVCGMMYIKELLLLIGKSSPCGSSLFPLSLSELSFTICLTPYNRK